MRSRRWGWGGVAAALLALLGHVSAPGRMPASEPSQLDETSRAVGGTLRVPLGAGRCSAVACHGSSAPVAGSSILHDEYTTWVARDPHANAFQALFSHQSRSIARHLAGDKG